MPLKNFADLGARAVASKNDAIRCAMSECLADGGHLSYPPERVGPVEEFSTATLSYTTGASNTSSAARIQSSLVFSLFKSNATSGSNVLSFSRYPTGAAHPSVL